MKMMTRLLVIACLVLPFAACKKEEASKTEAVAAPLSAPKTDDAAEWRTYVTDVAKRNMDGITNSPYVYFLPGEKTEGFGGQYERQLEKLEEDLGRGIIARELEDARVSGEWIGFRRNRILLTDGARV